MLDLSAIKNEAIKTLLLASKKFLALSPEAQSTHVKTIATLQPQKQQEICDFLTKENTEEKADDEAKMKILKDLYEQVATLEANFQKLLKADPEKRSRESDEKTLDSLLKAAQETQK